MKWIGQPVVEISPLEKILSNMAVAAIPENPTIEPNMKCIGSPVAEIWPFAYAGGIWNPHFGGKGRS